MASGRPLHVLTVTYDYYPFDVTTRRLAEASVAAGYEVDVLCIRQQGEAAFETYNGVKIHRLPLNRGFGESLPATILNWGLFTALAGAYAGWLGVRYPFDVVHVHNMPDFLIFSALIPKLMGARAILEIQDTSPELMAAKASGRMREALRWAATQQERISTRFADLVITVGWPFERKLLERSVPPKKLRIVINSADPGLFPASRRFSADDALRPVTPPHTADAPFIVMYWGTVAKRNGLATAVRALALALPEAPQLRLDIMGVGRGDEIQQLTQLAEELGVSNHVQFSNPVPAEHIVDFIAHGDVGIIPYLEDGFADLVLPTKAYEMAWLRRPIVASSTPAIRSLFRPESVALCQSGDPQSFAQALVDLYHHPEKRKAMVENAATDYEPYRWERVSQDYIALLADVAGVATPTTGEPVTAYRS